MKILGVGDVHLQDGPNLDDTLQALRQVHDIAVERGADLIIFPGDLYDRRTTPHERALMAEQIDSLAPVPVLIIRGNHDISEDLLPLALASHVRVFERPELVSIAGIDVLCIPWPERAHLAAIGYTGEGGLQAAQAALGDLIRTMAANRDTSRPLILAGHLSVCGALSSSGQPMVGREIQVVAQDLIDTGAWATLLGHIHKPQELFVSGRYLGSLTVQDFGEEDEEKGVELVEITPTEARGETIPIACRRWFTIEAEVRDPACPYIVECLSTEPDIAWNPSVQDPAAQGKLDGANLRYRYACTEEGAPLFDHAAIERRFAGAHSLKIVPNITRSARVRAADVASAKTNAEKFAAWGVATGTEITPGHLARLEELEGVTHGA